MFGPPTPGPRNAATICFENLGLLCQSRGCGFGFFLHDIIASVKVPENTSTVSITFLSL